MNSIKIVSVNVAKPAILLEWPGADVISAIDKRPVVKSHLRLSTMNLEGDRQADMRPTPSGQPVHGGAHQAVYAFPTEHYWRLSEVIGIDTWPGYMGENLTLSGATEDDVRIGDVWAWGDALLQVSAPRGPCYKLGIRMGKQALRTIVRAEGLVGWYLRVLQPGSVPTSGEVRVVQQDAKHVTVRRVQEALQERAMTFPELASHPALSPNLKQALMRRDRDLSGGVPERDS